ncbi:phosphoribosylamine--glycine ligase [bacterium]|nr:phosphoribosylamine--glycine ligase [bacterium]
MKVVVVGAGGREHALADSCHRQGHEVIVTPGNAGIPWSTPTPPQELDADLFVIGPEQPLVDGLADELRAQGKLVFGPGYPGIRIEASKAFMKELVQASGAPTARFVVITDEGELDDLLPSFFAGENPGAVVKTDGPAAGKGVTVCETVEKARADALAKLRGESFGESGRQIVIEALLGKADLSDCYERSVFALVRVDKDGFQRQLVPMMAQDYKRVSDDPTSPMTGGMGCYAPTGDEDKLEQWAKACIDPVLELMSRRCIPYVGFMYFGLMIVDDKPYVLEINIRFGDPEAEVLLPLVTSDLAVVMRSAAKGETIPPVHCSKAYAVTVVLAAEGYPDKPRKGDIISGLPQLLQARQAGVHVYAAGVEDSGYADMMLTSGGRVLEVTATGFTGEIARRRAYEAALQINFVNADDSDTKQLRHDIAAHWA